jgi:hypothetical protein
MAKVMCRNRRFRSMDFPPAWRTLRYRRVAARILKAAISVEIEMTDAP